MTSKPNRKDQHVHLSEMNYSETAQQGLEEIRFVHHSLPEIGLKDVSLATAFAGLQFDYPFFINAMTGGSKKTAVINGNLALIAKETGLAMATGSVSAALTDADVTDSFRTVRENNPEGIIFANLGAHHTLDNAKRAVDLLKADGLQIHLNAAQELIMPEGDRDFSAWLTNIEDIVQHIDVPVIIKEVGFGMSQKTIQQLVDSGVKTIDISGRGGTNFAVIENQRRLAEEYSYLYDFGQSTAESLLESQLYQGAVEIIASGGIKTPAEIVKALALGAKAAGISGEILHLQLTQGNDRTIAAIERWKTELATLMTLLGKKSVPDLATTDLVISPNLAHWCEARGIHWKKLANR